MKKHLSRILKWQLLWMCFFVAGASLAQEDDAGFSPRDSMDRFGAIGLRPGIFFNLNEDNQFNLPLLGVFIDYSFGKFHHSIELDFLTRKAKKIFRNTNSPCFTYHFSVKAASWKKMNVHTGVFANCRKDVLTRHQYFHPNDTSFSFSVSGFHTIFSLGPSVDLTRKIFFPGKKSFMTVGARIAYSFDILGYGTTFYSAQNKSTDMWQRIKVSDRFQKDVFVVTLKVGWGKLAERIVKKEVALGLDVSD